MVLPSGFERGNYSFVAAASKPQQSAEPKKLPDGRYLHAYDIVAPVPIPEWALELRCWKDRIATGFEPYYHLKRACQLMWPESIWHPWRDERVRAFCDDSYAVKVGKMTVRSFVWAGCAASGKTNDSGLLALAYFLSSPEDTSVTLTSTTKDSIRQRVWPVVQSLYYATVENCFKAIGASPLHMLNSKTMLQAKKGDEKHSIFAMAVKDGETAKAIENLRGRHTPRMMLIVDEASGTPEGVYENIPNMFKGVQELCLLFLSNAPTTKLDGFSQIAEPIDGWASVGPSTPYWHTKGVSKWQIPPSFCLHFSGKESPNVKAGKTLYPFLYSYENWLKVKDDPDVQRTAQFWSQDLGFWPPEEFLLTVLTQSLIEAKGAKESVRFLSRRTPVAAIDPGFGGDDCIMVMGAIGDVDGGEVLQIERRILIPILVDAKDEQGKPLDAEHQIARRVKLECEAFGVTPENMAVEATGTGRGAASVLAGDWGEIVRIESGGAPSNMPASEEDTRPAKDVYDRRITELWFNVRALVSAEQLKGLFPEAIAQFCSRTYEMKGKKICIEKKEDYKDRMGGKSPNDADAVATLVALAKQKGLAAVTKAVKRQDDSWSKFARQASETVDEPSIYEDEEQGRGGKREYVLEDIFV